MRKVTMVLTAALLGCAGAPVDAQTLSRTGKAGNPAAGGDAVRSAGPVTVTQEVLDGWNYLYRFITEVEFVLCLEGHRSEGKVVIDGFRLARMENASATSVRYHPCSSDRYIGTAHNHPPTSDGGSLCYRSLPDRRSFDQDERAIVDIILCGADRFLWVMKDDLGGGSGVFTTP